MFLVNFIGQYYRTIVLIFLQLLTTNNFDFMKIYAVLLGLKEGGGGGEWLRSK